MTPARLLLLSAVVTGAALWAPGAQALTSIQTSSPSLFSLTGSSSSSNVLSFTRFNTNIVGDDKKNVTLLGYDYILSTVTASGTVSLANLSPNPINGPFNSQVSLAFGRIDGPGTVSFNPVSATSAGSLPAGPSSATLALTGSATNVVSPDPYLVLSNPANFTTPPSTRSAAGMTTASCTAGCWKSTSSTSRGITFRPPTLIMSLRRSTM